ALSLWNNPCTLARRIEMLLDTQHPISRGVSRLWRGVTLTIIVSLACVPASRPLEWAALVADDPNPASTERPDTANDLGTAASGGATPAGTAAQSSAERDTDSSTGPGVDMRSNATHPPLSASYRSQL